MNPPDDSPPDGQAGPSTRPEVPPFSVVVPPESEGERLDVFLARHSGFDTRTRIKLLARAGGVLVDGRPAKPGVSVRTGQRVLVLPLRLPDDEPKVAEPRFDGAPPTLLYEDALILVVVKPAGLATHRTERPRAGETNLADVLERMRPGLSLAGGEDRPGIVHRLDKETSGVMVIGRSDDALLALKAQFRARRVEKEYRAIVFGEPRFDSDWIERNIAPHPERHDRMQVVKEGGRDASTLYEVIERFDGITYLRCRPRTGRTHQIRVHMASIGHSLVGDRMYRSRNAQQAVLPEGAPDPSRHCLHAFRLTFEHPHTHERMEFVAPLPADLEDLLAWLRVHAAHVSR